MFLYYVPKPETGVPACLEYAFESPKKVAKAECMSGPGEAGAGYLFADASVDRARVMLDREKQDWRQIPGTPYYCGRWLDESPTPEKLAREQLLDGHSVELDDGSRWQCAIARGFDIETQYPYVPLPRAMTLGADGKWRSTAIAKRYRRFLQLALAYDAAHSECLARGDRSFAFDDADELAIAGLTANYRLASIELSFFEDAYSVAARTQLISAILDFPTIAAWTKKKIDEARAGSDSSAG